LSYLLLPADERELVRHLCSDLGWTMITGRIEKGTPIAFSDPSVVVSDDLPVAGDHATGPLWVYLFWSPEWGRATAVGDAPEPRDLVRRVLRRSKGGERGELDNVVDPHASPIVIYRRCHWGDHPEGELAVGFLGGMDRRRADWPPELRRALGQAERWLKRGAVKIWPFDYVDDETRGIPNAVTWVRPAAWSWLEGGGRIANSAF
jgi:hypothetical protein